MNGRAAHAVWNAANYLSVAQLYLKRNVLLEKPLTPDDVKGRVVGHWGSAPGMNFIFAHLGLAVQATEVPVLPVVGTGHAATSVLAWLYLEGTLGEIYPELRWSKAGIERLVAGFGASDLFRTELSAFVPSAFAANGELGPGHAIAQGIALDHDAHVVVSVVGDGELETGPAAASLLASREIAAAKAGSAPVLVVNMNQWRMGARSVLGRLDAEEQERFFAAFGYTAAVVDIPDHESAHDAFCRALRDRKRPHAIVVRSEKGTTFPRADGFLDVVGSPRAHKAPLGRPRVDDAQFAVLSEWLESYRPRELFAEGGSPSEVVRRGLPPPPLRLGMQWKALSPARPLTLPTAEAPLAKELAPMAGVEAYLAETLAADDNRRRLRIFCPDELRSNQLAGLVEGFPDCVLEVLSEDVCHGWAEGYVRSGRHALLVSYEAFASRFASSFAQFLKFSMESGRTSFREDAPSLNYLLTSLGWHNVYSHQNPDFISTMLLRESDLVRVQLPVNGRRLVARLREALGSAGLVNAIVASKYAVGPDLDERAEAELDSLGVAVVERAPGEPDLVFAAAGDVACACVSEAAALVAAERPDVHVRRVLVEDIARLRVGGARGLDAAAYRGAFGGGSAPVVFAFGGYAATVRALLAGRPNAPHTTVVGYEDRAGFDLPSTLEANGMAPSQLARRGLELALARGTK